MAHESPVHEPVKNFNPNLSLPPFFHADSAEHDHTSSGYRVRPPPSDWRQPREGCPARFTGQQHAIPPHRLTASSALAAKPGTLPHRVKNANHQLTARSERI